MPRCPLSVPAICFSLCLAGLASACSGDDACSAVAIECTPQYQPTFTNVFNNTLLPSCGVAGSACHAPEGAKAGLVFAEIEQAYDLLTGAGGQAARVDPQALGCGTLLSRIATDDRGRVMPPGNPLADSEVCAIVQWVSMGAER